MWKKVRTGLSAGRVQSVALRLICDREKEIQAFTPREYWTIQAKFTGEGEQTPFEAELVFFKGERLKKFDIKKREKAEEIIDFLEITHIRKAQAGTLSYGLRKSVELARAVALKPDLILLDEPMAGMNQEEKEDMARYIIDLNEEWGMTVVMIEHDMGVVMDLSHRVMVLDFGKRIAAGEPDEIMANPLVKKAYLGEEDDALAEEISATEGAA